RKPSSAFLLALLSHDWPRQVRELEGVLKRVEKGTKPGETLTLDHLEMLPGAVLAEIRTLGAEEAKGRVLGALAEMLRSQGFGRGKYRGSLHTEMAKLLGVNRTTVLRWAASHGLDVQEDEASR